MDKQKKQGILAVQFFACFFVIFVIGFVIGILISFIEKIPSNEDDIIVQMSIDYGDGNIQTLPFDIVYRGTSVSSYIELASKRYGVPFDIRVIGDNTYVESIHNIHRTQDTPWSFSVNGKFALTNPIDIYLSDGDIILWKK